MCKKKQEQFYKKVNKKFKHHKKLMIKNLLESY